MHPHVAGDRQIGRHFPQVGCGEQRQRRRGERRRAVGVQSERAAHPAVRRPAAREEDLLQHLGALWPPRRRGQHFPFRAARVLQDVLDHGGVLVRRKPREQVAVARPRERTAFSERAGAHLPIDPLLAVVVEIARRLRAGEEGLHFQVLPRRSVKRVDRGPVQQVAHGPQQALQGGSFRVTAQVGPADQLPEDGDRLPRRERRQHGRRLVRPQLPCLERGKGARQLRCVHQRFRAAFAPG